MAVSMKYLKDENGNTISPIVSAGSVLFSDGRSLQSTGLRYKKLWTGTATIPSLDAGTETTLTTTDDLSNYDLLIVNRGGYISIVRSKGYSTAWNIIHHCGSTYGDEMLNSFMMSLARTSSTTMNISKNTYCPHHKSGGTSTLTGYTGFELLEVIGVKLSV